MDTERLRTIYPTLTDKELKEAAENLRRYFDCALKISGEAYRDSVDKPEHLVTIKERSNSKLKNHSI